MLTNRCDESMHWARECSRCRFARITRKNWTGCRFGHPYPTVVSFNIMTHPIKSYALKLDYGWVSILLLSAQRLLTKGCKSVLLSKNKFEVKDFIRRANKFPFLPSKPCGCYAETNSRIFRDQVSISAIITESCHKLWGSRSSRQEIPYDAGDDRAVEIGRSCRTNSPWTVRT